MLRKVEKEKLYSCCDHAELPFKSTDDIPALKETIGQERALRALDFGLGIDSHGFNIYILGEGGTGKLTTIKRILDEKAAKEPVPDDCCYVYNFKNQDIPKLIKLKPGLGLSFQKDLAELVTALKLEIPKAFESKEYEKQKTAILEKFQEKQKDYFSELEAEAKARDFTLRKTVSGLILVPVKKTGETLSEEEYENLEESIKKKVESIGRSLQDKLDDIIRLVREDEKNIKDMMVKLEQQAAMSSVGHRIDELKEKYKKNKTVTAYLDEVRKDILENLTDFQTQEDKAPAMPFAKPQKAEPTYTKYEVNLFINNGERKGAPVVIESNPTYYNLFGRVEHKLQYGVATTDFTMIKAGSLQDATGGYLVIDAMELLKNIFSYDSLKRAIKDKEVKIEDVWEQYRLMTTVSLKPEAIPFNVKIILVGNPRLYYMLYSLDDEYRELFKVKADYEYRMVRDVENISKYASFIKTKCDEINLMPLDMAAVAKVIEYGSRLADHQQKLSAKFSDIADILREADYWAKAAKRKTVTAADLDKALEERVYRCNKVEKKILEATEEGSILIDTDGAVAGQINALSVLDLGDYRFGMPTRITAKTYAGRAGIVNIERETKMSGRIHEKAILILTAYLGSKYATQRPMSLTASLVFEQLYGGIEGDSATCAEVYALLSSISSVPIKQCFAITGSMNQHGEVQPIGGVNEKIEGFFEVCKMQGLNGEQGAIIPSRNIMNLMLKKEVVDAVIDGKFNIYCIDNVEDAIEILMGMQAGQMKPNGKYPKGTLNYLIVEQLQTLSRALKEEGKPAHKSAAKKKTAAAKKRK